MSSNIALLFQNYFGYSRFSIFLYLFYNELIFTKKIGWCYDWDCIESTNNFRRTDILIAYILTHKHIISLHLLMPSLISLSSGL